MTAAGVVLTDAAGAYEVEAFGPGMVSLGTSPSVSFMLSQFGGQTAEDRLVGAVALGSGPARKRPVQVLASSLGKVGFGLICGH